MFPGEAGEVLPSGHGMDMVAYNLGIAVIDGKTQMNGKFVVFLWLGCHRQNSDNPVSGRATSAFPECGSALAASLDLNGDLRD